MLVFAVLDDSLSPPSPLGDSLDIFVRREDAERFIEEIRGDDPELAKPLRIEERELEAASHLPAGRERFETYGRLDVDISRNAAPAIPMTYDNAFTFVSTRTGCVVVNPFLDLTSVCLK
jgi:hypothetical protein